MLLRDCEEWLRTGARLSVEEEEEEEEYVEAAGRPVKGPQR